MKYCEDCIHCTRHGSGLRGDYTACALLKIVINGRAHHCEKFTKRQPTKWYDNERERN